MPTMYSRKTLIAAKLETGGVLSNEGSIPIDQDSVLEILDVNFTPYAAEFQTRNLVRPWFGASPSVLKERHVELEFSVELVGSGTLGTAPAWGKLLRACGMAQVVVPATEVEYKTIDSNHESIGFKIYLDGMMHIIAGAKGNASFEFNIGEIPKIKFKFIGLYAGIADRSFPSPISDINFAKWQTPTVCSNAATDMYLFGTRINAKSMSIDLGNEVQYRNLFAQEDVVITNRMIKGSVSFELTNKAEKDWISLVESRETATFDLPHGTVGKRVLLNGTDMRLLNPRFSDHMGVRFIDLDMEFVPNSTGDDFSVYSR